MKSHTSLVAQQTRLNEWADLIRDCQNRPQGMKGDPLGCPIIKSGITATPISKKYNDQEIFLTDILSFPGSSGSPIFIKYNDSYILVGIHYASATTIDDGSHIGLGFCIKDSILYNWIKGI